MKEMRQNRLGWKTSVVTLALVALVLSACGNPGIAVGSDAEQISADTAKSLALEHAGLNASEVTFVKAELGKDDGRWEYDVEFRAGNMEYDYEIDADSGKILKSEKDWDD